MTAWTYWTSRSAADNAGTHCPSRRFCTSSPRSPGRSSTLTRRSTNKGQPLGIIHRDVTPHNILVSWDGIIKLADFGIAKAIDRAALTEPGVVKGKLSFVAPEYLLSGVVTKAADVFGLGCVLHHALAGVSPYGTTESRRAAAHGELPNFAPSIPDDVVPVLKWASHPSPKSRCPSAGEMARATEELLIKRTGTIDGRPLIDWLQQVQNRQHRPAPADRLAELFHLEATGTGMGGLARFESRPAGPFGKADPSLPTAPDEEAEGGGLDFIETEVAGVPIPSLEPTVPVTGSTTASTAELARYDILDVSVLPGSATYWSRGEESRSPTVPISFG